MSWSCPYLYRSESRLCNWCIVFTLTLASMSVITDLLVSVILQSEMQGYLAVDETRAMWLGKIFFFMAAIAPLYATRLAFNFGFKRTLLVGLMIFWFGSIGSGFATNYWEMFVMRLLSGLGGGVVMAASLSYLPRALSKEMLNSALVVYSNGFFGLGIAAGCLIGGIIGQSYHWKMAFLMNIHLAIPNLLLLLLLLPETDRIKRPPFDYFSFFSLTTALFLLLVVVVEAKNPATTSGWYSPFIQICLIGSGLAFSLFFFSIFNRKYPLIEPSLFRQMRFSIACLGMVVVGMQIFGIALVSVGVYETIYLYQRDTIGYLLSSVGFIFCIFGAIPTLLANKIAPRYFIFTGLLLIIASNFMHQQITIQSSIWQQLFLQNLRSVGIAILIGPFTALAFSSLPRDRFAKASALIGHLRFIAATFGSGLVFLIVQERTPFHALRFGEQVDIQSARYLNYTSLYQERLIDVTSKGTNASADDVTQLIINNIKGQATISALNDAVTILGYATLAIFFLIFGLYSHRGYRYIRCWRWKQRRKAYEI